MLSECYCFFVIIIFNDATVIALKTTNLEQLVENFFLTSVKKNCQIELIAVS